MAHQQSVSSSYPLYGVNVNWNCNNKDMTMTEYLVFFQKLYIFNSMSEIHLFRFTC